MRVFGRKLLAALLLVTDPIACAQAASALPGGASSLQEVYGGWQVICKAGAANAVKPGQESSKEARAPDTSQKPVCVLAQTQLEQASGKLVLSLEFQLDMAGKLSGHAVLPFGLAVTEPLLVQSDGKNLQELRIATCLAVGCITPVALAAETLTAFSGGKPVAIVARDADGRQAVFPLQSDGFGEAFKRLQYLGAP